MTTTIARAPRSRPYDYPSILAASEKVRWRPEDLIGGTRRLDFSKPFLPESLARSEALDFLSPRERLLVNHIRGHGYLYLFIVGEEFILPYVLDHMRPSLTGDDARTRALLGFAAEEAKHIDLFHRFRAEFERGFGAACDVVGPPERIGATILGHGALPVALAVLGLEWMTQSHYLESVRCDEALDPCFEGLLRHHWMEEAQHAKLDALITLELVERMSRDEIEAGVDGYFAIGGFLDSELCAQVELDLATFERVARRRLAAAERERFLAVQRQAQRWTFLGSALSNARFLEILGQVSPRGRELAEGAVPTFS
jgi:hypothetical protein